MVQFPHPPTSQGTPEERYRALVGYLYSVIEDLEVLLDSLEERIRKLEEKE